MEGEFRYAEAPVAGLLDRRRKVWLECDGEPYDFRAVDVLRTDLADGVEFVTFICPRCRRKHQSLLFG